MDFLHWWNGSDVVTQLAALVLLAMSVASWVVMLWKMRLLSRAHSDIARGLAAFWQAPDWRAAQFSVTPLDRDRWVLLLVEAASVAAAAAPAPTSGAVISGQASLERLAGTPAHATRLLRGALGQAVGRLQYGQVVLATVGATAPFVGLLGTVWGIHHALAAMAGSGQISVERLAGPVGEALIMTAAGLAVAIPAVLGYNVLGRRVVLLEAELEGFAHDLLAVCTDARQD